MNAFKQQIETALTEIASNDIPDAIRHLSGVEEPDDIFFTLTDLRKKFAAIDSRIFDMRFRRESA